jgi:hypothetical protein
VTAGDGASIRVEGLPELRRKLKAAGDDLEDLRDANHAASRIVLTESDRRVPRRSGRLAATGRTNRAVGRANVLYGSADVPYAMPIHWGQPRRNIQANPWVTEAAEATEPVWVQAYADALDKAIRKVGS